MVLRSHLRVAVCWNWIRSDVEWWYVVQPPSGGCVLKLLSIVNNYKRWPQPPSGGCVLKLVESVAAFLTDGSHLRVAVCWNFRCFWQIVKLPTQPPSGGCVLKLKIACEDNPNARSHLRVAVCWNIVTEMQSSKDESSHLRVAVCWNGETIVETISVVTQPPSGGCVLKHKNSVVGFWAQLAATFGWLCVETDQNINQYLVFLWQPPSGGCVLKPWFWALFLNG